MDLTIELVATAAASTAALFCFTASHPALDLLIIPMRGAKSIGILSPQTAESPSSRFAVNIHGQPSVELGYVVLLLPAQSVTNAFLLTILIAAIQPYLASNLEAPGFRGRKVFLGDAGSLLLGFRVAWALIDVSQASNGISPANALWLIAIPLMDTLSVMMGRRKLRRSSPFKADRSHLHHLMTRVTGSTWPH